MIFPGKPLEQCRKSGKMTLCTFFRHTKLLARNRERQGITINPGENPFYSFTDEDQKEQLQIFVDWLRSQRVREREEVRGVPVSPRTM